MYLHCLSDGVYVVPPPLRVPTLLTVNHSLVTFDCTVAYSNRLNDKAKEGVVRRMREESPELECALKSPVAEHSKSTVYFKLSSTKVI